MNQNKNQITTTIGTGVALKNASKSLKITNKLLAEVDDFEKHWKWWNGLNDEWKETLLFSQGMDYDEILTFDCSDKILIKNILSNLFITDELTLISPPDFEPLPYFSQLKSLDVFYNDVCDISPLEKLVNLQSLWIDFGSIKDFSSLNSLPNLKYLTLSNINLENLSQISELKNLKHLGMIGLEINDIHPISNMISLTSLDLSSDYDSGGRNYVSDLSAIGNLNNLLSLSLRKNNINNLLPLFNLRNLIELDLRDNPTSQSNIDWLQQQLPNCEITF